MVRYVCLNLLALLLALPVCVNAQSVPFLYDLRCEHLQDPIGIDARQPRFTWKSSGLNGQEQVAYEVLIGATPSEAKQGKLWKSGRINSKLNIGAYTGKPLLPFTRYYYSVKLYVNEKVFYFNRETAFFETGMYGPENWQGSWISDGRDVDEEAAPAFRKQFRIGKKIKNARAYIAVAGLYELYLNGQRVGDHRLDPMYTRFDRRNLYVTYDVTRQLQHGENVVGVLLGNGWYNHQSTAVWNFHQAPWRGRPAFCMDLRLEYEDGSIETVSTARDWKTALSPVVFNSIYTAEHYDATKEQPGWNKVAFDDKEWKQVIYRAAPSGNIVAQQTVPIKDVDTLKAVRMVQLNDSVYVFHFPRNIAGVTELSVKGQAGTVVRLKHGEDLKKDGSVDLANIIVHYRPVGDSDPFQTDIYTLKGSGEEVFRPRFNYKGFQYVELTCSKPLQISKESLIACSMHSAVQPVGSIRSSDSILNKIWAATNASYLANLYGYPTDCPQREKNGWTGDAHIAIETGLYNFDGITVYEKWMADHRDEQQPNGVLPSIIPTGGWGYEWGNGPDWTSTIAIIPWNVYLFTGDSRILSDNYENIKRYVDHITTINPAGLTDWGLGDWVPVKSKTPVMFTSSLYYYTDAVILSKAAKLLGKADDQKKYSALALRIKQAFNEKYFDSTQANYADGNQTALSAALYWQIVPDGYRGKVSSRLASRVMQDSARIDVGLLGSKAILNALSENGHADLACKMASQRDYPSWGWWIENGATTLFENWKIDAGQDLSRNHIMFGEIGAWYFKGLAGIFPSEAAPGFKEVVLRPNFLNGPDEFEASHEGPYGKIISSWKRQGAKLTYHAKIPGNSHAILYLPNPGGAKKVYVDGKPAKQVSGIRVQVPDAVLRLGPGDWSIEIL
ncbi:MAG TPA: family 78 glycoside hydrolase catalytic domain [Pseudobacter sp.]|nr:family 78 glycoside hydrolase catalytic domain [Pseudobacter sp.]